MARAERSTVSWLTSFPQQFQLFQPSGGVRAMASPARIRRGLSSEPKAFSALSVT